MTENLIEQQIQDSADMPPIPEKFIDTQTGALRTDDLIRSYQALERKYSSLPRPPATQRTRR